MMAIARGVRAVIYAVATSPAPELTGSVSLQVAHVLDRAAACGYHVVGPLYVDYGESWKPAGRPGLDALLHAARAGGFDVLLVDGWRRFGGRKTAEILARRFAQLGVWVETAESE
jgi:DNA invertase Pin-like site-specific DNA recombinase